MKLAILHFHLNRGGVTQVVLNQLRALQSIAEDLRLSDVLVLHGGRADGWPDTAWPDSFRVQLEAVDGLDYDDRDELHVDALTSGISSHLERNGFAASETILHIHNHSLGKNVSLPGAVKSLAERGFRAVLQIHDFAEDLRPANYEKFTRALRSRSADHDRHATAQDVGQYVYPDGSHIHYALLNNRDESVILKTGVNNARVHCLPNPVTGATSLPDHAEAIQRFRQIHGLAESQRVVLYPVRAIRRKNVGELLLWAAAADEDTVFALTLPATSEAEVPSFLRWKELAARLGLPVLFDVGLAEGISFEENLAAASRIVTTSVAEGFGLAFLEAWLHQRPLIGRNLPEITADFAERGVALDHLGDSVQIPIEWVGAESFVEQTLSLQAAVNAGYGQPLPSDLETTVRQRIADGRVDFAALTTGQQSRVIERVATNKQSAAIVLEWNRWMALSLSGEDAEWQPLIDANAKAVKSGFSLASAAEDLRRVYEALLAESTDQPVGSLPHPENVLNSFLDVSRLCPVRVEQ